MPLSGLTPNPNGTGKTQRGWFWSWWMLRVGSMRDVSELWLIATNQDRGVKSLAGVRPWSRVSERTRRHDTTPHTLLFLLDLPLDLCIVFSSKNDSLILLSAKSHGFLLSYYVTSLSWSRRWVPMIFVLLPAAVRYSGKESQNPNATQMLMWILVGFSIIGFSWETRIFWIQRWKCNWNHFQREA